MRAGIVFAVLILACVMRVKAVEIVESGTSFYNTTDNISSSVATWSTGWGASGVDGWDYVGELNGASAVYLGNGWVLTAGHVGAGAFTLDGNTYAETGSTYSSFTYVINGVTYTADLTLFQISTVSTTGNDLTLPALTLASTIPTAYTSQIVLIGNGGGSESWGADTVTAVNQNVTVSGYSYKTRDFETAYGTSTMAGKSATNHAQLVTGDSGGADFIYVSGTWELAGISEAVDTSTGNSYFVQIGSYYSQIESVISSTATPVPEPEVWSLLALAGSGFLLRRRSGTTGAGG